MTQKIELSQKLFEFYNEEYRGYWGRLLRAWRYWLNNDLNLAKEKDKLTNELINTLNVNFLNGVPASDIIPMLITGDVKIVRADELREWRVYYEQEPSFLTFRYCFWNGKEVDQTDDINDIPLLTTEELEQAPEFMQSLAKREIKEGN